MYLFYLEIDEEQKENDPTQTNLCMTSSKDTIQVIRLATAIQVTTEYIRSFLTKTEIVENTEISIQSLRRGRKLYCFMAGQKAVFAQVIKIFYV